MAEDQAAKLDVVTLIERVAALYKQDREVTIPLLVEKLKCSNDSAGAALRMVKLREKLGKPLAGVQTPKEAASTVVTPKQNVAEDYKENSAVLESNTTRIRTVEQLLAEAKVDLDVWEVERHQINKWEVGRREKSVDLVWSNGVADGTVHDTGKIFVEPLFQVKVWLVRKKAKYGLIDSFEKLLDGVKGLGPRNRIAYPKVKDGHLLEIAIPDLHLGKYCWGQETGETDYSTKIAKADFQDALRDLVSYARHFPISRIVYPIGNDFFNVDNDQKMTLRGTPQDEDSRWQKSFVEGELLTYQAIKALREIAPVDVIMVSGNHDWQRVFYLGRVLHAYFAHTPGVTVDCSPEARKYYSFGNALIGYTHGDEEATAILPNLMAQRVPQLWAKSEYREWHLGHVHHKKSHIFAPLAEQNGVRIRYIPSLSPADSWHAKKGFISLRAAEAFVWHPTNGCKLNITYHPKPHNHIQPSDK